MPRSEASLKKSISYFLYQLFAGESLVEICLAVPDINCTKRTER